MQKLLFTLSLLAACAAQAADTKIIFIAGRQSHGPLAHEHRAGCLLLAKSLGGVKGVVTEVHTNGWVSDEKVFEGAAAIVVYSDGGGGHPFLQQDRLQKIGALMQKGVGLGAIHYAVEPTTQKGNAEFRDWIGGCFETHWSVNPHWDGDFKILPKHPVTSGVKPFKTNDEWYFHMRFRDGMKDVLPILSAVPPASTMNRGDGPHSGNPAVREAVKKGEPQHVMWVATRAAGLLHRGPQPPRLGQRRPAQARAQRDPLDCQGPRAHQRRRVHRHAGGTHGESRPEDPAQAESPAGEEGRAEKVSSIQFSVFSCARRPIAPLNTGY
jgi:hypothetical protein